VTLRRGFHPARGQRRKTEWARGPGGNTATAFSATGTVILGSGILFGESGLTLVRFRGSVQAYLSTADAITSGMHCAIGVGLVTTDAFAIGQTAMPTPIADAAWDGWLYHRFFDLHVATAAALDSFQSSIEFEIDSKAMRKLDDRALLFANVEVVEVVNAVMQVNMDSRVLLKLP